MSMIRPRSARGLAVALGAALLASPAFAQTSSSNEPSVEDVVRAAPPPSKTIWGPLAQLPDQAMSKLADAAHLHRPAKCKPRKGADPAPCWSLSARYTVDQSDPAFSERVEDDMSIRYGQRPRFLLFFKRPF